MKKINLIKIVPFYLKKKRLDLILVYLFKEFSRTFLKKLILEYSVFVDDNIIFNPKKKIFGGEIIRIFTYLNFLKFNNIFLKNILNIVYEDDFFLIINKSFNMIIHPFKGCLNITLFDILLNKYNFSKNIPRAGILHRLDKNTTGLIIIAKKLFIYKIFLNLFKKKKISREYLVLVCGNVISGGTIKFPISRNNFKKKHMKVDFLNGKNSITHYRVIKKYYFYTYLKVFLETGKTHQIRLHLSYINFPVFGDLVYNKKNIYNKNILHNISLFPRQAMHAQTLKFFHPFTNQLMYISTSVYKDIKILINYLNKNF
ncbi:RluA family pseudouridine synthase [Buchnera aphidicola]|uniref:RluA family pseudouridine synthase n=1 Tax=Buchnera aphidicola TaxID=9 RepID=UPI0031B89253